MRFAVIGDPVSHSLSPRMHMAAYAALGLEHSYETIRIPADEIDSLRERLNGFKGVNVTIPLKELLAQQFEADDFARAAGAINTIDLAAGTAINTDGPGFIDVIRAFGPARTLLLGAGGSARSIALALSKHGYQFSIWNRTVDRAEELIGALGLAAQVSSEPDIAGFDLVVNATSASLSGCQLPIDWERAEPGAVAFDLYYSKEPTVFCLEARAHGLSTIDGRELLVAQGARSFEWWLGVPAPREAMRRAVYETEE